MKKNVLFFLPALFTLCSLQISRAQASLAPDQNPDFIVSRDKYIKLADSINAWHSTTIQETYKAIDYLEDKREARLERQAFHRQLRLTRALQGWSYDDAYYSPANYYNSAYYNGASGRNYRHRYSYRYYNNYWRTLPLFETLRFFCP